MRWLPFLACGLVLHGGATAQVRTTPFDALSKEGKLALNKEGLVVLDKPLNQGFSAYVDPALPVFITSDSILMAYHRLFEEYVGQAEAAQLVAFRDFWPELWKGLPKAPPAKADEVLIKGHRRARLIVATAYRLLTGNFPAGLSAEERAEVTVEVARVEKGEGDTPPPWILPQPTLEDRGHYSVFVPGSLFEGNEPLEHYYRFRKWLQEMAVDPADDSTLAMVGFMVSSLDRMGEKGDHQLDYLFSPCDYEAGLLRRLSDIGTPPEDPAKLPDWRDHVKERVKGGHRWRLADAWLPPGSRITRSLLQRDPKLVAQTPEAVASAFGNELAAKLIAPGVQESIRGEDFVLKDQWQHNPLPNYYAALRALNVASDERLPDLLRSEAWKRKQLNATLGSWTEFRYALQIGTREEVFYASEELTEPGFVEPLPAFYHLLGVSAEGLARERGNFQSPRGTAAVAAIRLQGHLARLERIRAAGGTDSRETFHLHYQIAPDADLMARLVPGSKTDEDRDFSDPKYCAKLSAFLKSWWAGEPTAEKRLAEQLAATGDILTPRLERLAATCFRLEAMAERQLAGRPWEEHHEVFLNEYGRTLGWLMFYERNSYLSPQDDAPRIVRYATAVDQDGRAQVHHAAISQPRLLLIHYPSGKAKADGSIPLTLCQGAVYAFRNVTADKSPSRAEWQAAAEKSAWPEWMKPIVASYEPAPVKEEK